MWRHLCWVYPSDILDKDKVFYILISFDVNIVLPGWVGISNNVEVCMELETYVFDLLRFGKVWDIFPVTGNFSVSSYWVKYFAPKSWSVMNSMF